MAALSGVLLLLVACGGGGGSAGGSGDGPGSGFGHSLPPSTGPGDVENFFPDAVGSSWNYFATVTNPLAGQPENYLDSVTVTGTRQVNGTTASVFLESNPQGAATPTEGYFYKNLGGISFLGTNDTSDTITPQLVPYIVGLFPMTPATVAQFTRSGINFGSDLDGDGVNETANVSLTSTVIGVEALSLGIGNFARTVRTSESLSGSVVLSRTSSTVPFSSLTTRWSAPGVGIVRTTQSTTVQGTTTSEVMEARGYTTGGVPHGFSPVQDVASGLPANLLPFSDAPALATDGTNFLAATETAGGLTARLFTAQGISLASVSLTAVAGTASPAAAFDGSNYWVVYSPYSSGTSGSITSVYAKRITAAGTLLDSSPIDLVTVGGSLSSVSSTVFSFDAPKGLLVYSAYDSTSSQHLLYGVLVNANGTIAGAGSFPIAVDNATHLQPAISFDGTNYLVVWKQLAGSGAPVGSLYGVHVTPSGTVVEPSPVPIATPANGIDYPRVAFDGTNHLAVWIDRRNESNGDLYGARVSTTIAPLDGPASTGGFAIHSGQSLGHASPGLVYLGSEYLVSWVVPGYAVSGSAGVQAARVGTTGTLPSGPNTVITVSGPPSAASSSQLTFPVVAARSGRGAVVWFENQSTQTVLKASPVSPF